jgi:hypothetical protein
MDSFLRLYSLYRSLARWRIALQVYKSAPIKWKACLWGTKTLFVWFAASQFIFWPAWPHFVAMLLSACGWAWSFDRARRAAFAEQYRVYRERMKYFERDYQHVRYLEFRNKLQSGSYAGSLIDALAFLDEHIETDSQSPVAAHPFFSATLAGALAILGGAAGQWHAKYIIGTLLFLLVALYFSYMVLGTLQTPQADLKEFKRFLLWARDEQIET